MVLLFLLQNLVVLSFPLRTSWSSYSLQNRVAPCLLQSRVAYSFLPQNLMVLPLLWLPRLGLNPSAHLPLQPHFPLLLQSVTPVSISYPSSFSGLP